MPRRIALVLVALTAVLLGVWRFGSNEASPAIDAAFVAMTFLVLVLGIREWVRVLQTTPRIFDHPVRRFTRVYTGGDESHDSYTKR